MNINSKNEKALEMEEKMAIFVENLRQK